MVISENLYLSDFDEHYCFQTESPSFFIVDTENSATVGNLRLQFEKFCLIGTY